MANKKTVGIVCDNYKVHKFKTDLTARGFTELTFTPFTKDTTTIKVFTTEDQVFRIETICKAIEAHFKARN